jgi:lipopolysaccharide/colanic/teichoic acid biosynthesis glycosyltransferase
MSLRTIVVIVCLLLLLSSAGAWAYGSGHEVPEVSTLILAPAGLGAIMLEQHRRRSHLGCVKQGLGVGYFAVKRAIDILLASVFLLMSLPLFAVIALLVKLDSPGPLIFRRRVIGKGGRSFDMLKFRSMVDGAEEQLAADEHLREQYYVNAKLADDPRVSRVGRILRKTSLDELPQLINILLGQMTFVGPRPIHSDECPLYGDSVEKFKTVTPGVSGLWQICGRSNVSYQERVRLDMLYIDKRSVLYDVWILLSTVPAVLMRRGAL